MSLEPVEVSRIVDARVGRLAFARTINERVREARNSHRRDRTDARARIKKYERVLAEVREDLLTESDVPAP